MSKKYNYSNSIKWFNPNLLIQVRAIIQQVKSNRETPPNPTLSLEPPRNEASHDGSFIRMSFDRNGDPSESLKNRSKGQINDGYQKTLQDSVF